MAGVGSFGSDEEGLSPAESFLDLVKEEKLFFFDGLLVPDVVGILGRARPEGILGGQGGLRCLRYQVGAGAIEKLGLLEEGDFWFVVGVEIGGYEGKGVGIFGATMRWDKSLSGLEDPERPRAKTKSSSVSSLAESLQSRGVKRRRWTCSP